MTTRLPTRDQLATMLAAVRAEPEGPDRAAAIERLEGQLAALDAGEGLEGPDADLAEPEDEELTPAAPAAPAAATGKPAPPFQLGAQQGGKPPAKPDNKPF